MLEIRNKRKLGVSTSIDVAKYIAVGYALGSKTNQDEDNDMQWKLLNEALVDYSRNNTLSLVMLLMFCHSIILQPDCRYPHSIYTAIMNNR